MVFFYDYVQKVNLQEVSKNSNPHRLNLVVTIDYGPQLVVFSSSCGCMSFLAQDIAFHVEGDLTFTFVPFKENR